MQRILLIVFGTFLFTGPTYAGGLNAAQWQALNSESKGYYVLGLLDAWKGMSGVALYTSTKYKTNVSVGEQMILDMLACLNHRHLHYGEIVAIVQQQVTDHPDQGGSSMEDMSFGALRQTCKQD